MSLPAIAKQLEAKGRHGDTMLVHMSPNEVKGLHAIAEAHGKKITINPETGLPEAFSLKSLLPTVLGAGLAMTGIGAPIAALMVGGGYTVATGSLQKGLMAGLGAYGGAGLTGSLMGAGTAAGAAGANAGVNAATNAGVNAGTNAAVNAGANAGVNAATNAGTAAVDATTKQIIGGTGGFPNALNNAMINPSTSTISSISQNAANVQAPTFMQTAAGNFDKAAAGAKNLYAGGWDATSNFLGANKMNLGLAAAPMVSDALSPKPAGPEKPVDKGMIRPYTFDANQTGTYADAAGSRPIYDRTAPTYDTVAGLGDTSERQHFNPVFTAQEPYAAARGGIVGLAPGGKVESEAAIKAVGMNTDYPMAHIETPLYSTPLMQRPDARDVINPSGDVAVDEFTGEPRMANGGIARYGLGGTISGVAQPSGGSSDAPTKAYAYNPKTQEFTETTTTPPKQIGPFNGNYGNSLLGRLFRQINEKRTQGQAPTVESKVTGGIMAPYMPAGQENMASGGMADGGYNLGGYSDGGRLLRGPGDGVSDSIPASIGGRQPARLADGEFVVPARIVSELGNGSTEAGARKLYAMMDRVQKQRKKSVGKGKVAVNSKADKHLPA
jgi:hypothetical protein